MHVEVDIAILYYNWSKNCIGTKLRKQSKRFACTLSRKLLINFKLSIIGEL